MVATASLAALRYAVIRGRTTRLSVIHTRQEDNSISVSPLRSMTDGTQARGVTVRVTDAGGTNVVEIDMLVTADAIAEARD